MPIKLHSRLLALFNLLYILAFTAYYITVRNYEFLFYILILVILVLVMALIHKKFTFPFPLLWALSAWGLMHMAGGGLYIEGVKLYNQELVPIWVTQDFYILTFDQFVHFYLYFIVVFLLFYISRTYFSGKTRHYVIYPLIVLASIGIGALNEVAEFIAVLFFQDTGVGGYYNNAWDIVFNSIGSIAGIIVLHIVNTRPANFPGAEVS